MTQPLSSLHIRNYRQLRDLKIEKLGQVNLIVGGNNTGKSTVLEAIRLLVAKGASSAIEEILSEHGENTTGALERAVANLFFGRDFPSKDGEGIYIGEIAESGLSMQLEHIWLKEETEEREINGESSTIRRRKSVPKAQVANEGVTLFTEAIAVHTAEHEAPLGFKTVITPLADFFARRSISRRFDEASPLAKVSLVPARLNIQDSLAAAWDEVVLTDGEEHALQALRLIEPDTQGLAFVQRVRMVRRSDDDDRFAVLRIKGALTPIPLQSMGDGMARLLQLVLAALQAKGGFLLIDELENGLHYSVQEQVWGLLFDLAKSHNIQIFATTHSSDCLKAFSKVAVQDEQTGVLLRMERMEDNGEAVVSVVAEEPLSDLLSSGIEVR